MTADVRSPTPQMAVMGALALEIFTTHIERSVLMAHPGDRLHSLTEIAEALAELVRVVAEERAYAVTDLRLPDESVRGLARRLRLDESRVRQMLAAVAEPDSAPDERG